MSLINQALRKAQRDRTPNRMAQPGEQSAPAYAQSAARGMSPALVIGLVIAVAVLIGLVVGLSVVIFRDNSTPARPISNAASATPASGENPTPAPQPAHSPIPQASVPALAPTTAAPGESTAAAPSVVDELRKAREAAEAKAAAEAQAAAKAAELEAKAAAAAKARAEAKPSQDIITWLGQAKLSGVKISTSESKVILNGKAYAVGEYVNYNLGLKVMVIQQERVLFMDNNGKKYMKRL
ncbi:hypothetical protein QEH52_11135 [Coraliomargarita sp. SDUM461003]|uniref:Type II secretion system protein GspC N-terminal domain-containing protein n=1 Tax=Thalassobacterium maritimum TaxID=3041265 RepID=A0ABU1AV93_9BACT|nr:hypothetical protein [Coraliomargarita sp. SDUM461003]MDQ8208065.1 hypothetical protein [Coraliomargarita sp. SDUM461003]|tara:strand:+ start:701 stop:1417 length:717 start_codon:yes stop_codon:yes gene_type:complete